jgi:hypothetical protein
MNKIVPLIKLSRQADINYKMNIKNASDVSITGPLCLLFQFQIKAASALARLRLLNVLPVRLRRLDPRRLDVIFDLKPELVLPRMAAGAFDRTFLHLRMAPFAILVRPFLAEPFDLADAIHVTSFARAGYDHMGSVGKGYLVLQFDHLGGGKGRSREGKQAKQGDSGLFHG